VIAFASICSAQVRVVERLSDGSYVVSIDGAEYRAISGDKAVELAKQKVDLIAAEKLNQEKDSQIAKQAEEIQLLKKDVEIAGLKARSFEADFKRAREDAARNFSLFQSERDLRIEAGSFIPRGNSHGFWGKFLDAMNSQQAAVFWKIAVPTYSMVRCSR